MTRVSNKTGIVKIDTIVTQAPNGNMRVTDLAHKKEMLVNKCTNTIVEVKPIKEFHLKATQKDVHA